MPAPKGKGGCEKAIRQIERTVCVESDGSPVDLLRVADKAASTTLGVFLKGRVVERVVEGSCGWLQLYEGDLIRAVNGVDVDAYSVLERIRECRDSIGQAISLSVDRKGERHEGRPRAPHMRRAGTRLARRVLVPSVWLARDVSLR